MRGAAVTRRLVRLLTWARLERTPTGALFGHRNDPDRNITAAPAALAVTARRAFCVPTGQVESSGQ
ncbi:MAG: hypothetical protein WBQ44_02735 [Rhodococcus sp. (in: high G+C Gram-positive bacteria)]